MSKITRKLNEILLKSIIFNTFVYSYSFQQTEIKNPFFQKWSIARQNLIIEFEAHILSHQIKIKIKLNFEFQT